MLAALKGTLLRLRRNQGIVVIFEERVLIVLPAPIVEISSLLKGQVLSHIDLTMFSIIIKILNNQT
jgi:hypothetical protein